MNKKISLYIIVVPIFFVWISIIIITYQYVKNNNVFLENEVNNFRKEFIVKQKTDTYSRIYYFKNIINLIEKEFYEKQFNDLEKYNNFIVNTIKLEFFDIKKRDNIEKILNFENNEILIFNLKKSQTLYKTNKINNEFIAKLINSKDNKIDIKIKDQEYIFYKTNIISKDIVILSGKQKNILENQLKQVILKKVSEYDIENSSYLFIIKLFEVDNQKKGKIILHQSRPNLEGKFLSVNDKNYNLASFTKSFNEFLPNKKEGFINYSFEKPESPKISKKMSYLYTNDKWNWILGTGFYFDDLEEDILEFEKNTEIKLQNSIKNAILYAIIITLIVSIVLYIIAKKISKLINTYANNLEVSNENLSKQKSVLKSLFDKSLDGIIVLNQHGQIVNCNESFVKMLDITYRADVLNKKLCNFSSITQINDKGCLEYQIEILKIISSKTKHSFEWLFEKSDKTILTCEVRTTKLIIDNENVIHAVVRDITHSKKLEEMAKKQQLMLAEESKKAALGEMLTMIAHQWRQPLNNINLLIHFARDGFKKKLISEDQIEEITKDMKSQIDYLSSTINDFTNFANPYKEKASFSIGEMIEKTLIICTAQIEKNSIKIIKEIEDISFYGVENEFMQILLNLINNSKDAFIEKDIPNRYIFINVFKKENEVVITLKDNAGGIDKDIISRVFEPYFTTKHKNNGTGIGLYMCQEIISQYKDGKIKVKNSEFTYDKKSFNGCEFKISFLLD